MEDAKAIKKKLTTIIERFVNVSVQFENKLATEQNLKQQSAKSIAGLQTLKEVDGVDTQKFIDGFMALIKSEGAEIATATNKVCGDMYQFIHSLKD